MNQTFIIRYSTGGYANRRFHEIEVSTKTGALAKAQQLNQSGYPTAVYAGARVWTVVDTAGFYLAEGSLYKGPQVCETEAGAEIFDTQATAQEVAHGLNRIHSDRTGIELVGRPYQPGPIIVRKFARIA